MSAYASVKINPQTTATYKAIGKLDDRSGLSQEMADLCTNLPIHRVVKQNNAADQTSDSGDAEPAEIHGEGKKTIGTENGSSFYSADTRTVNG